MDLTWWPPPKILLWPPDWAPRAFPSPSQAPSTVTQQHALEKAAVSQPYLVDNQQSQDCQASSLTANSLTSVGSVSLAFWGLQCTEHLNVLVPSTCSTLCPLISKLSSRIPPHETALRLLSQPEAPTSKLAGAVVCLFLAVAIFVTLPLTCVVMSMLRWTTS